MKLKKIFSPKNGRSVKDSLKKTFPQVQPARWMAFSTIKNDWRMIVRIFLTSINIFKKNESTTNEEPRHWESTDDYLRQEKISPDELSSRLTRLKWFSFTCYALALAIFAYMGYIFVHVGILNGFIGCLFGLFVLAKGLQFTLFIRQLKSGDFTLTLKNLFSRK